jgi:hypothetical protein
MSIQITDFHISKQDEVAAVLQYLRNEGIDFYKVLENIDINSSEPTDVHVKDINKRFQIVVGNFELYEGLGRAKKDEHGIKMFEFSGNRRDVWRRTIQEPLKKKQKYGESARGIILLIKPPFDPPWWVEEDVKKMRVSGRHKKLNKLFFDEISLVLSDKNVKLFP